jgi:hypothetical protein
VVDQAAQERFGQVCRPDGKDHRVAAWKARRADDQVRHPAGRVKRADRPPAAEAEELGGGGGRVDGADLDAGAAELTAESVGQPGEGVLGRRVEGRIRRRPDASDGGDVDDHSRACRDHRGQRRLDRPDCTQKVRVDKLSRLLLGQLLEGPEPADAGVVDEHVHPFEVAESGGDEAAGLQPPADVDPLGGDARRTCFAAALRDLLEPLQAAGAEGKARAFAGEGQGGGLADPARGAGDQDDTVLEAHLGNKE